MEKLKVAHIICDLKQGGGQRSTIDLIRATNSQVDNYLILLENKKSYKISDIKCLYICKNKLIYKKLDIIGDYILSKKLSLLLKKYNIDIAISHMEVTAKVLRFIKIPKIYYMRANIVEELTRLKSKSKLRFIKKEFLYKKIFNNQNLVTVSRDSQKILKNFLENYTITTIYNPFDFKNINYLANKNISTPNCDYIIQIGAGTKEKRQDIMLEAFSKIENKTLKLLLLGTIQNDKIINIANKLQITNRVIFMPFTANPYPFIKNAKLLVVSSEREGLPRVIVESLTLKTPVVSTNCDTGPREILVDELKSYLAEVNNSTDLAKKINLALQKYPEIHDKYIEKFNKKIISKKFLNLLIEIKEKYVLS